MKKNINEFLNVDLLCSCITMVCSFITSLKRALIFETFQSKQHLFRLKLLHRFLITLHLCLNYVVKEQIKLNVTKYLLTEVPLNL